MNLYGFLGNDGVMLFDILGLFAMDSIRAQAFNMARAGACPAEIKEFLTLIGVLTAVQIDAIISNLPPPMPGVQPKCRPRVDDPRPRPDPKPDPKPDPPTGPVSPPVDPPCDERKKCLPCDPVVGSVVWGVDRPPSPAHNGIPTPHSHKLTVHQSPPAKGCKCFFKREETPESGIKTPEWPGGPPGGGGVAP